MKDNEQYYYWDYWYYPSYWVVWRQDGTAQPKTDQKVFNKDEAQKELNSLKKETTVIPKKLTNIFEKRKSEKK